MKTFAPIVAVFYSCICAGQSFDTSSFRIKVESSQETNRFFTRDYVWRGADGASSIDLENGKVLWLFSDGFICHDSSASRKKSTIIRNSIAIQDGYNLKTASLKYYWNSSAKKPQAFFHVAGKTWFWTGHGVMIRDRLLLFLMEEQRTKTGLGFEAIGWYAALVSNPYEEPSGWNIKYIRGGDTFGTIAGSAAVVKDEKYVYAFGAVEPATHEVYLLRWNLDDAYMGNISNPDWWINGKWAKRETKDPIPEPLFVGGTEYSVHYDTTLKKYIQIQSFGFGEGKIGLRMADSLQGPWTDPYLFYTPDFHGVKQPFIYAAKAHPELHADGFYVTYNVNSFDFEELVENQSIYFPKFILVKIERENKK